MKFLNRCLCGWWIALLLFPLAGQGQTSPASGVAGQWKGPLQMPGGSLEIVISVTELATGKRFAVLDVPLQKVNRMPMTVETTGDTVVLYAAAADSRFVGLLDATGKLLQGTWQQPGYKAPLELTLIPPPAALAKNFKFPPPYRVAEVAFSNQQANIRLAGTLTVPAGEGPFPAVLLLSDTGPQDRDGTLDQYRMFGALADYLTRRGIAVLRYDDRGVGQSQGNTAAATTADLVKDAQAGLNFLRTRPEVDVSHIGLIGHGEGGNIATLAAAEPLPPTFIVLMAAYGVPGQQVLLQQQANVMRSVGMEAVQIEAATKRQKSMLEIINLTADNAQAQAIVANMLRQTNTSMDNATALASAAELTTPWYRYFLGFDPQSVLAKVRCPVLLLNGTKDLQAAPETNLTALDKGLKANKDVTARKLPGVNHLFQADQAEWAMLEGQLQPTFSPAAQDAVREWIMKHVQQEKQ
ncbi:alpha/beta hydrolase family protein [Hymenobacter elongatus]|uniref:Alpha/beta hydrolase n=1 Tax=Hymenobacter elongatus TaxID=877208 RepID=A0A4Z0PMQ0_9BACT|nr:alpha/beta fold hydrolase [Hymenobacter elongatus]TGE17179.1 alpha/beta hydrolase [Hymenobacter elongatus]